MANVRYMGVDYPCATALKGADYVHLVDANGKMIAAFDGVSDFSGFSITSGSWTTPAADNNCFVAVMKDDGMIGKGGHRCCDLIAAEVCETTPTAPVEGKWYLIKEV